MNDVGIVLSFINQGQRRKETERRKRTMIKVIVYSRIITVFYVCVYSLHER